jgi:hypothetical protein
MFKQPICFILGAGASADYDLPAGAEMKTNIAGALNIKVARYEGDAETGDTELTEILRNRFKGRMAQQLKDCRRLSLATTSAPPVNRHSGW